MRGPRKGRRYFTVMIVPDGGIESRSFRLSYVGARVIALGLAVGALAITLMAGTWWYFAARASRVVELETQVAAMQGDRARIESLARQLQMVEARYEQIRGLFGAGGQPTASEVWLPPSSGAAVAQTRGSGREGRPTSWPLTERGFVTQGLLEGADTEHPGVDIAIPSSSYVRAAGAGVVVDAGEDPVYGRFVVLEHADGYTSLYGHANLILVQTGQSVRQNEVIALSGSTGRSTAPHLHFEILLDGEPVDPLTLVTQP